MINIDTIMTTINSKDYKSNDIYKELLMEFQKEFDEFWDQTYDKLIVGQDSLIDDKGMHDTFRLLFNSDYTYKQQQLFVIYDLIKNNKDHAINIQNNLGINNLSVISDSFIKEFVKNIYNFYNKLGRQETFQKILDYTKYNNISIEELKLNKIDNQIYFTVESNNQKEQLDFSYIQNSKYWKQTDKFILQNFGNIYEQRTNIFNVYQNLNNDYINLFYLVFLIDNSFEDNSLPKIEYKNHNISLSELFDIFMYVYKNLNTIIPIVRNKKQLYINFDRTNIGTYNNYFNYVNWLNDMKKYPNAYNNQYETILDLYEDNLFDYLYSDIFKLKNHDLIKRFNKENFNDIQSFHFINDIYDNETDEKLENNKSIFQRQFSKELKQVITEDEYREFLYNINLSQQNSENVIQLGGGFNNLYMLSKEFLDNENEIFDKEVYQSNILYENEIFLDSGILFDKHIKYKDSYYIKNLNPGFDENIYTYYKVKESSDININSDDYFFKYTKMNLKEQINNNKIFILDKQFQKITNIIELPYNMQQFAMIIIDNRFLIISNGLYVENEEVKFHNKILIYDLYTKDLVDNYNLSKESFKNIVNPIINIFEVHDKKYINISSGYKFTNGEYKQFDKFINIEYDVLENNNDREFIYTKQSITEQDNIYHLVNIVDLQVPLKIGNIFYYRIFIDKQNKIYVNNQLTETQNFINFDLQFVQEIPNEMRDFKNYLIYNFDNNIILFGGYDKYYKFNDKIYYYSIDNHKWYYQNTNLQISKNQSFIDDYSLLVCQPTIRKENKIIIDSNFYKIEFYNNEQFPYYEDIKDIFISPLNDYRTIQNGNLLYNEVSSFETYRDEIHYLLNQIDENLYKQIQDIPRDGHRDEYIQEIVNNIEISKEELNSILNIINKYLYNITKNPNQINLEEDIDITDVIDLLDQFKYINQEFIYDDQKLNIKEYPEDIVPLQDGIKVRVNYTNKDYMNISDQIYVEIL